MTNVTAIIVATNIILWPYPRTRTLVYDTNISTRSYATREHYQKRLTTNMPPIPPNTLHVVPVVKTNN